MISITAKFLLAFSLLFKGFTPKEKVYHPFHVSTTDINHNNKEKSLEITVRIFADDFENALSKRYKTKIDLRANSMDSYVKNYLVSNLKLNVNKKDVPLHYIGFENDHEATIIYLEVKKISSLKQLKIENSVLFDLFDDQMNIVHASSNGARKSAKTNYPEKALTISF